MRTRIEYTLFMSEISAPHKLYTYLVHKQQSCVCAMRLSLQRKLVQTYREIICVPTAIRFVRFDNVCSLGTLNNRTRSHEIDIPIPVSYRQLLSHPIYIYIYFVLVNFAPFPKHWRNHIVLHTHSHTVCVWRWKCQTAGGSETPSAHGALARVFAHMHMLDL